MTYQTTQSKDVGIWTSSDGKYNAVKTWQSHLILLVFQNVHSHQTSFTIFGDLLDLEWIMFAPSTHVPR